MSGRPHPAMAERRREVARARGRRRRTGALAAVGAVALGLGLWWLATGPVLAVRSVSLAGYEREDRAGLAGAIAAAARQGTVLRPATGAIRAAARRFPWVADVSVRRDWPLGLAVDVIEAEALAVVTAPGGERLLVSAEGRVLGPPRRGPNARSAGGATGGPAAQAAGPAAAATATTAAAATAPVPAAPRHGRARITLTGPAPKAGEPLPAGLRAGLLFISALEPEAAGRLRDLRLEAGRLVGRLEDGPELRLGRPERMVAKALALGVVLDQIPAEDEAGAEYLDLSLPERPAVGGLAPLEEEGGALPPPPGGAELAAEASTGG